jgi:hypothetical protein
MSRAWPAKDDSLHRAGYVTEMNLPLIADATRRKENRL